MTAPLLHLTTPAEWRAALASGAVAPPSLGQVGFVHLSTPEQVALPADRLFHGGVDLLLLVLDPARIRVEIRFEPGVAADPASMCFPHAYGPVPASAVLAVLPYRPRPDGGFDPPVIPPTDAAGRFAVLEPSLLRRAATSEVPVTGGVTVIAAPFPASYQHNQLLVDGTATAAQVVADADRVLGGHGLHHRRTLLTGAHLADTAAGLAEHGWEVDQLVGMAAPTTPAHPCGTAHVEHLELAALRPMWDTMWQRDDPDITAAAMAQLADRHLAEEHVIDVRYLAIRQAGAVVASCLLKIDGGTALLDMMNTEPDHRGQGHGDALVREALAVAGTAGADLVVLNALARDWPRGWYARRGFVEVATSWTAGLPGLARRACAAGPG